MYMEAPIFLSGSVDCSGFVAGIQQSGRCKPSADLLHVPDELWFCYHFTTQLRPGDLVFYNNPNHVAIYISNGAIVHGSPETGINVTSGIL